MSDALQRLIRDYRDETGESYEDIARRAGMSSRTVQALATRERSGKHLPRPDTLAKLAKGLRVSEAIVRQAAGYEREDVVIQDVERRDLRMLVAVSAELDEERLDALLRRGRLLLEEQREERGRRGGRQE